MKGLAEVILGLCGLVEAEGRLLRENAFTLTRRCVILTLGLLFGAGALALGIAAAYEVMLLMLPEPGALAVAAVLCALVCAALLWSVREKCEKYIKNPEEEALGNAPKAQAPPEKEKTDKPGTSREKESTGDQETRRPA